VTQTPVFRSKNWKNTKKWPNWGSPFPSRPVLLRFLQKTSKNWKKSLFSLKNESAHFSAKEGFYEKTIELGQSGGGTPKPTKSGSNRPKWVKKWPKSVKFIEKMAKIGQSGGGPPPNLSKKWPFSAIFDWKDTGILRKRSFFGHFGPIRGGAPPLGGGYPPPPL
jgi:hypothetical protein